MDQMSITSKWFTSLISKIITKQIKKQVGEDAKVDIHKIKISLEEGTIRTHIDLDASIGASNLYNLLKKSDVL